MVSMTAFIIAIVVVLIILMVRAGVGSSPRRWDSVRMRIGRPTTLPEKPPEEAALSFAGLGLALPPRRGDAPMTPQQRDALLGLGLASVPSLSEDQARTLISASLYTEVVFRTVAAPGAHCPRETRWRTIKALLADEVLRDDAVAWIASRYQGGRRTEPVRRTRPYAHVRAALFAPAEPAAES